jgi:hypothetical protein
VEGIVRQARILNPSIDVVLLHFVDPEKVASYRAGVTPEVIGSHERVAGRYGVASLDLAREVTDRMDAGEFSWEKDFVNLHPSPFGQGVYFRSIVRMLESAWREPSAGSRGHAMPAPLDAHSYFRGRLVEPSAAAGWRVEPSWRPADKAATRPRFVDVPVAVGDAPGAVLTLPFEGTGIGLFVTAGPDAGVVEFSVDGGAWRRQELSTKWSKGLHIPWAYVLDGDLAEGRHELRLRMASGVARIVHFLVN